MAIKLKWDDAKKAVGDVIGDQVIIVRGVPVQRRIGGFPIRKRRVLARTKDNLFSVELIGSPTVVNEVLFTAYVGEVAATAASLSAIRGLLNIWDGERATWLHTELEKSVRGGLGDSEANGPGISYQKIDAYGVPMLFVRVS